MAIDYSQGRYLVYGPNGERLGTVENDEYVRNGQERLMRIDNQQVYDLSGKCLGSIDEGTAFTVDGDVVFTITPE